MERCKFQVKLHLSSSKNTDSVRFNVPGKRSCLFMQSDCTLMKYTSVFEDNIRRVEICLKLAGTKGKVNELIEEASMMMCITNYAKENFEISFILTRTNTRFL